MGCGSGPIPAQPAVWRPQLEAAAVGDRGKREIRLGEQLAHALKRTAAATCGSSP